MKDPTFRELLEQFANDPDFEPEERDSWQQLLNQLEEEEDDG